MRTTKVNTHTGFNLDWTCYRYGDNTLVLSFKDTAGDPYDISGETFTLHIRNPDSKTDVLTLTEGEGLTKGESQLTIALTATNIADKLKRGLYFVQIDWNNGSSNRALGQGKLRILDQENSGSTSSSATLSVNLGDEIVQINMSVSTIDLSNLTGQMIVDKLGYNPANAQDLTDHEADTNNPHSVTKTQVGLGSVDNTADADKPVSTAQQSAIDQAAADAISTANSYTDQEVGALDSVTEKTANKGQANGYASLDGTGKVPADQLPVQETPNASETVAGKVEEATDAETQAGTETGGTGARLFVNPKKLTDWWTWVKTQAQTIAAMWTFNDVQLENQKASAGTYRGVIIDENGKIVSEANIVYNPTTKQFQLKGANTLDSGYTLVVVNSNEEVIARFRNDKTFELGGSAAILEVNEGIESGAAAIRFIDDQVVALRLQDKLFNDYLQFRSTHGDMGMVVRQAAEFDYGLGERRITRQFSETTSDTAEGYTTIFEFTLADGEHYDIKVLHAEATATDNVSITSLGVDCADVRKVASSNIEGNTDVATQSRLPSTVMDGGFEWNLDTTDQKIQYRFKNVSGSGKNFVVFVEVSIVIRTTPEIE